MPLVDIQLLKRKVKFLATDLKLLKKYEKLSFAAYLKDETSRMVVERLLERITGRIIDINYHILKTEYEIYPEDYYNSFIEVGRKKVIPESLARKMAKSAGLRNALAHEYDKIDDKLVYDSIVTALAQVPEYLRAILKFLE